MRNSEFIGYEENYYVNEGDGNYRLVEAGYVEVANEPPMSAGYSGFTSWDYCLDFAVMFMQQDEAIYLCNTREQLEGWNK